MSKIADRIRSYVNDQDVADHYGEWGILRRDQRRLIRELCDTCDAFERAADEYFEKTRWISVEERLPDTTEKILVYCSNGEILPAKYIRVQGLEFWFEETYSCHNITHWMPLPEAPKKGGGE